MNPASQLAAQAARAPQLTQHHGGYGGMHGGGLSQHRYPQQQQQQQYGSASYLAQQHSMQHVPARSQNPTVGGYGMPSARSSLGGGAVGSGGYATNPGASGYTNPSASAYGGASDAYSSFSAFGSSTTSQQTSLGSAASARPGHIALPPASFPSMAGLGPLSPVGGAGGGTGARGSGTVSVPLTPGMPGFTFHAIPQTPPTYPHHFLSPGLGPFSPPLGADHPATPGAGSSAFNPLINPAPGAPLHNPLFPPVTSAQYAPPSGAHQEQPQTQSQKQLSDAASQTTQQVGDGRLSAHCANGTSGAGPESSTSSTSAGGEGYPFPLVQPHLGSSLLQRRASSTSAASPAGETQQGNVEQQRNDAAAAAAARCEAETDGSQALTETIARLSVRGKSSGSSANSKLSIGPGETRQRHPLSSQLLAGDGLSLPQGSAIDDTTSSSSSGGGTPGWAPPPAALAPPALGSSHTLRRTSDQPPSATGHKAAAGHFGAHLSADAERRRSFAGGLQE
jgi:hypothetical protein